MSALSPTTGVKTGKAQNQQTFSSLPPKPDLPPDRHKPRGRSRGRRFLRRSHRRLKLQQVDFRQHGRAPWCALTVSGQGGAFGSLAAAALRAGASADSGILSRNCKFFSKTSFVRKATPFWGAETIFGQVFGRGGMSEIPKTKVPPTGAQRVANDFLRDW